MVQALRTGVVIFAAALALTAGTAAAQDKHDHHGHNPGKKSEKKVDEHKHDEHTHEDHHDHVHTAPHGGTLVVLGNTFAHLEFVLDSEKGKLTAYALDSHAEKSVRLKQPEIELKVAPADSQGTTTTLRLVGVASPLTGEQVGNTSEFSVRSDKLKGVKQISGVIRAVTIKGNEFKDVSFRVPEDKE